MRWFLLWLVICWIIGVVGGVVGLEGSAVTLVVLALVYWGWRYGLLVPVLVAGAGLVGLGYLYGGWSAWQGTERAACVQPGGVFEALVTDVLQEKSERTQYVVKRNDRCTLLVTLPVWPRYGVGDRWQVRGEVEPVSALPEELAGYGAYLRHRGIGATMLYPEVRLLDVGDSRWSRARAWVRRQTNAVLREPEASVVRAMMWGERGAVEDSLEQQLTAAGVRHMLAISGLHVSLVVGGLLVIVRQGRWSKGVELMVLLGLLWGYVWLVGAPVSATRAGSFWTGFLMGWRGQVLVSWLTALVITLLVIVSWRPVLVLDVSLQLSVAAVTGIMVAVKLTRAAGGQRRSRWDWRWQLAAASGALVATGPITAVVFGELSWAGLLVNVLVLPVLPAVLVAAMTAMLVGLVSVPAGILMGQVVRGLWWYIEVVTEAAASVPGVYWQEVSLPGWWLAWWYPVVGMIAVWWLQRRAGSWRVLWE